MTHNYLNVTGNKPAVGEIEQAELVPNLADNTLWTKDKLGNVVQLGGAGEVEEAPIDGGVYARKDAGWVHTNEIPVTTTPTLSGASVVNEDKDLIVTITNYSATATYSISTVSGTSVHNNDRILTLSGNHLIHN